ncbi:MAG: DUF2207 domain-containing protein [Clostridia bacterium]|jgi:uncharacterized membrane protein YgcG|nr:DUF2207 domain-containing protein [Clostridia bacterium]
MKKVKSKLFIIALILFFVALLSGFIGLNGSNIASAYDDSNGGKYSFYYEKFNITFDVKSNRELHVTEELTVHFTGYYSTGFMRDIPVNGGELVKDVRVTEITDGKEVSVPYSVYDYTDDNAVNYITADIGSSSNKTNKVFTYKLTYRYCLTKAQEGKNVLAINAIGAQDRRVESAEVTFILPDGYLDGTYVAGQVNSTDSQPLKSKVIDGKTVVGVNGIELAYNEGITFNLNFKDGALSTYKDYTPYYFVIAGIAVILLMLAAKVLFFNKDKVVPVVNFEAPEKMNPLMMGKLIDGVIDSEDVTSMLFYWADKGYIKIDLTNENDPTLIRIMQNLPDETPRYEKDLYAGLFASGDSVKTSSLKNRFYRTIDRVSSKLNSKVKNLYTKSGFIAAILFTVLGALICGLAPLLLAMTQINTSFTPFMQLLISIVPCIILFATGSSFKAMAYKKQIKNTVTMIFLSLFVFILYAALFYLVNPRGIIPQLIYVLYAAISGLTALFSFILFTRSPKYVEQLNQIVGFRDFILLVEKDKLEQMLESNPQFYYHVLPYAQVLGVSDKWEDKFKDITIAPPQWSTGDQVVRFVVLNSIIRNSSRTMASNMSSRPSSSGGSGRGGFGGGHVGGGHGGGGSRGR